MGAANILREKCGGKILIHRFDRDGLRNPDINLSSHIGIGDVVVEEDARVDDGDVLHIGNLKFKVIYTPGHTIGSISLYCEEEKMLFSGDTLFRGSWGRTDLPTSNFEQIIDSITYKLMDLQAETIVYPGHRKINNNKRRKANIFGAESKRF